MNIKYIAYGVLAVGNSACYTTNLSKPYLKNTRKGLLHWETTILSLPKHVCEGKDITLFLSELENNSGRI